MLKEGRHQCKGLAPNNGWFGEAGQNKTPYIRIPFIITEGPCEGHEDVYQAWLGTNSFERSIKNLAEVFGWDGDLERLSRAVNNGPFVDKPFSIVVESEDYQGKQVLKIKWLNKPGGGETLMPQESAAALAAKLTARAKQIASGKPAEVKAEDEPW